MRKSLLLLSPLLGSFLAVLPARAQGIYVTPAAGVYAPLTELSLEQIRAEHEGTLALGLNLDFGKFRGTLRYASGTDIDSVSTGRNLGEGKLLAVAGDVVLRPIPRLIIVQPYILAGAGLRREDYSVESGVAGAFPDDESSFALHAGIGADVTLGRLAIVGEFTDFISKDGDGDFGRHDAFAMVGLRMRLF